MSTPNDMPANFPDPHIPMGEVADLRMQAAKTDFVMHEFLKYGYDTETAVNLTEITLNLYDNKERNA